MRFDNGFPERYFRVKDIDLVKLHAAATDPKDLEQRLKSLAQGIGDVTAGIFLREMRGMWEKADPLPSDLVVLAAQNRGIVSRAVKDRRKVLELLRDAWKNAGMTGKYFPDFEAALVRAGIELREDVAEVAFLFRPSLKINEPQETA